MHERDSNDKVAVLVATRNRPALLKRLLISLSEQSLQPAVVVIVDASEPGNHDTVRSTVAEYKGRLASVELLEASRIGLTQQKNQGVTWLLENARVGFVQIFDDDVVPSIDYLERARSVMLAPGAAHVGAVAGVTPAGSPGRLRWLVRTYGTVFCLRLGPPGSVTSAGLNAGYYYEPGAGSSVPTPTDWVFGCSMYRMEIFVTLRYWESHSGYALYEDVDFSLRVGRGWTLMVLTDLCLGHEERSKRDVDARLLGYQQVVNRRHIVGELGLRGNLVAFYLSVVGQAVYAAADLFARPSRPRRRRLSGLCWGLCKVLSSDLLRTFRGARFEVCSETPASGEEEAGTVSMPPAA